MSEDEFWKSTPAKIGALSDMKLGRPPKTEPKDPDEPYMGAECDWEAMNLGLRAATNG
jgi:hypothetical protein